MSTSKFIEVNGNIDCEKKDVHIKHLNIASKNIEHFNLRFNSNHKIVYDAKDFQFYSKENNPDSNTINSRINTYRYWAIQDDVNSDSLVVPFLNRAQQECDNIKQSFYGPKGLNILKQSDIEYFNLQKDKFTTMYKNYFPLGFLSNQTQEKIKSHLNGLIKELNGII